MNNNFPMYFYYFCFICLFYDCIRRYSSPLTLRWGTWLPYLYVFSVSRRSVSWRVHLAQWTQYRQVNLSIYPLNVAFSKWPS